MVVRAAVAAAQHRIAVAEQVVSEAETRRDKERFRRGAGERNAAVPVLPRRAGQFARPGVSRVELRRVEDREAEALAVVPLAEVVEARAEVERQLARRLPAVRSVELERVETDVVQRVLGLLLIIGEAAEQEVGQHVAAAVGGPGAEDRQAVRVTVARLVVDEMLEICPELQRVDALHLRYVVGEVEQVLGREQGRVESTRVEQRRPITPTSDRRNLVQTVLEETLEWDVQSLLRDLLRVFELVREVDEAVAEYDLVGQRRREDLRQAGADRVRTVGRLDRSRVRHLARVAPPQADRELLQLGLNVVAGEELGLLADVVIDARQRLLHILIEIDRLDVVVTGRIRRRIDVRERQQVNQRLAGRINHTGWNPAAGDAGQIGDILDPSCVELEQIRRVAEIAVAHRFGRHARLEQPRVQALAISLEADEEEELIAVLVEVGSGNQDRAAQIAAGEDIPVLRLRRRSLVE